MYRIRTNVSQAYWCAIRGDETKFEPASFDIDNSGYEGHIAWLDVLLDGGIAIPSNMKRPLMLLIAGPPGSGKTTLALEMCYRLAQNDSAIRDENNKPSPALSVYVSTEQETAALVENAKTYNYAGIERYLQSYNPREKARRTKSQVIVYGREQFIESPLPLLLEVPIRVISSWINQSVSDEAVDYIKSAAQNQPGILASRAIEPDVLVVDSLNLFDQDAKTRLIGRYFDGAPKSVKMIVFILDTASSTHEHHEFWEYMSDVIVRIDHEYRDDYFVRTVEVVKARYQSHIWGKHQLKIYKGTPKVHEASKSAASIEEAREIMRRNHPYRHEGGVFIFPSIHYYLSTYKRRERAKTKYADSRIPEFNSLIRGVPEGRCTAFFGSRGGHKSHLGYHYLLHRIIQHDEAALVISLRDDERMTRDTMNDIVEKDFEERAAFNHIESFERNGNLEILYFHPGNITPEEFFHRTWISVLRMKKANKKLTVLFNSLDQLTSRFPLCAKQELFVPGMVEMLSGEGATSIFIAVDEAGQPIEQYGLLPMADLILSFYPYKFSYEQYKNHVFRGRNLDEDALRAKLIKDLASTVDASLINEQAEALINRKGSVEEVVVQVVRMPGGERAGARGILELVTSPATTFYTKPGLYFTALSSEFESGELVIPVDRQSRG